MYCYHYKVKPWETTTQSKGRMLLAPQALLEPYTHCNPFSCPQAVTLVTLILPIFELHINRRTLGRSSFAPFIQHYVYEIRPYYCI